jgi:hypothetical protein
MVLPKLVQEYYRDELPFLESYCRENDLEDGLFSYVFFRMLSVVLRESKLDAPLEDCINILSSNREWRDTYFRLFSDVPEIKTAIAKLCDDAEYQAARLEEYRSRVAPFLRTLEDTPISC